MSKECIFPVWKTITLGTGLRSGEQFCFALEKAGMHVGRWANDMLRQPAFCVSPGEIQLDLVIPSLAELGFVKPVYQSDVDTRASEHGLKCCPDEVGPQLRLQYQDQPSRSQLLVSSIKPIVSSDGNFNLFRLSRGYVGRSGPFLKLGGHAIGASNEHCWCDLQSRRVYVRPR